MPAQHVGPMLCVVEERRNNMLFHVGARPAEVSKTPDGLRAQQTKLWIPVPYFGVDEMPQKRDMIAAE